MSGGAPRAGRAVSGAAVPEPTVRLLGIDLDFTLLDSDRSIPSVNAEAIRRAGVAGVQVVLASGRIASGMRYYAEQLGLDTPLISCNGAYVVWPSGEAIERHTLDRRHTVRVLGFCREHGVHANVYAGDEVYFAEETQWSDLYLSRVKRAEPCVVGWDALADLDAYKIILVDSPERVQALRGAVEGTFQPGDVLVTLSEPEYLEVLSPDCSKGSGLEAAANALGVPQAQTAAVGDYYNDLPMLNWAARSAAVANAPEEVRQAADVVVPAHNEAGVAAYVELLLQNWEQ